MLIIKNSREPTTDPHTHTHTWWWYCVYGHFPLAILADRTQYFYSRHTTTTTGKKKRKKHNLVIVCVCITHGIVKCLPVCLSVGVCVWTRRFAGTLWPYPTREIIGGKTPVTFSHREQRSSAIRYSLWRSKGHDQRRLSHCPFFSPFFSKILFFIYNQRENQGAAFYRSAKFVWVFFSSPPTDRMRWPKKKNPERTNERTVNAASRKIENLMRQNVKWGRRRYIVSILTRIKYSRKKRRRRRKR